MILSAMPQEKRYVFWSFASNYWSTGSNL